MISSVIYFIDGWVKTNIGPDSSTQDAESLARQCMDDAQLAGFTSDQIEQDLGTDLFDFMASELQFRSERLGHLSLHLMEASPAEGVPLDTLPASPSNAR
jgi:hypothetical protein